MRNVAILVACVAVVAVIGLGWRALGPEGGGGTAAVTANEESGHASRDECLRRLRNLVGANEAETSAISECLESGSLSAADLNAEVVRREG